MSINLLKLRKLRGSREGLMFKARHLASNALTILSIFSAAFMTWKSLALFTNTPAPVMVVISESMAPAFHRGDVIILWNREPLIKVGDITVCWFPGREVPMVHRAVQTFWGVDDTGINGQLKSEYQF